MSPRIIQLPMSGRDRRHYVGELKKAEQEHRSLVNGVHAAYRVAHRLACEEWNARQFIGGDVDPSPTIEDCIHGGCELLEVQCKRCGRNEIVDLTLIVWPRGNALHTLERALSCQRCKHEGRPKARTNLVALRTREPDPETPRVALGRSGRKR